MGSWDACSGTKSDFGIPELDTSESHFLFLQQFSPFGHPNGCESIVKILKPSIMGRYPVHRQRFPCSARFIISWVGILQFRIRVYILITIPGVQNPHWLPWFFTIASWTLWSLDWVDPIPSTVVTAQRCIEHIGAVCRNYYKISSFKFRLLISSFNFEFLFWVFYFKFFFEFWFSVCTLSFYFVFWFWVLISNFDFVIWFRLSLQNKL